MVSDPAADEQKKQAPPKIKYPGKVWLVEEIFSHIYVYESCLIYKQKEPEDRGK